ncbi:hypothetical protein ACQ9LF_12555 [Anaerohalosphaeraceae bacterium U12dextr]
MALLGAILAALASVLFFQKLPEKQHHYRTQQTELMQQAGALDKLKEACIIPEQIALVETVSEDIIEPELPKDEAFNSILGNISPLQLNVLTAAGAIGAGAASYGLLWSVMYLGSLSLYAMIRALYRLVDDKESPLTSDDPQPEGQCINHRNPYRLFPIIFKLTILIGLALILLSIVVWQLTAIKI